MKRVHREGGTWYVPPPPPPEVAVFACRACGATLSPPLRRLDDRTLLATEAMSPLVPAGSYWPVADSDPPMWANEFVGAFAVRPDGLVGVGNHPDRRRWVGCCGPSGGDGPNRVCACGHEVGTERADCLGPTAVYLDPKAVRAEAKAKR